MADVFEAFETQNLAGTTTHFSGAVGTSFVNLPAVDGTAIQSVIIQNLSTGASDFIEIVLSEGATTTFWKIKPEGVFAADIKGSPKHVQIRGQVASVNYQAIINREVV